MARSTGGGLRAEGGSRRGEDRGSAGRLREGPLVQPGGLWLYDPPRARRGCVGVRGDEERIAMTGIHADQRISLTGWQGGTSGLRVGKESRQRVFMPYQNTLRRVRFELPGHGEKAQCRITSTYWTTCPEFRSAEIGRWMERRGE